MTPGRRSGRDEGFTLVETIVVVLLLGLIAAVIAAVFVVIVRTTTPTEARADDARTILGLNIYLPEDVNSTPPGGYSFDKGVSTGCAGASPGVNLLHLTWTELSDTYRVSYRYTGDSSGYKVVRYSCLNGGDPSVTSLTSELPPIDETTWTPGSPPIVVLPYSDGTNTVGLTFEATTFAGEVFSIVARSNNTADTLPPTPPVVYPPPPPGNAAPTALPVVTTVPLATTSTIAVDAQDPESDPLVLTVSNFSSSVDPAGWTITTTGTPGDLSVGIRPPATATEADTASFDYTVRDPYGRTATSTVTISLTAAPVNQPPVAGDVSETIQERTPTVIDLPITDPDADPLDITLSGVPASLTVSVSGTQLVVASDGTEAAPATFTYTVDDGQATATANVTISVVLCQVTGLSPASPEVGKFTNGSFKDMLKSDVTFTVGTSGNCTNIVTLAYDHDSNGTLEFLTFGSVTNQVTFLAKTEQWTGTPVGNVITFPVEVYRRGAPTGITATLRVTS